MKAASQSFVFDRLEEVQRDPGSASGSFNSKKLDEDWPGAGECVRYDL